jgi:hypothetical protein
MLPMDKSVAPEIAAETFTNNSGADVPIAIIVSPTTKAEIPNFLDIEDAPSTKKSALFIKTNSENIIINIKKNIGKLEKSIIDSIITQKT